MFVLGCVVVDVGVGVCLVGWCVVCLVGIFC